MPKVTRIKFLGSEKLFCFRSICKFGRLKNLFKRIIILSQLSFRFAKFILLVQKKKLIYMNHGRSTKPERRVRLDLIPTMRDIYINSNLTPFIKFTGNKKTEFKDILSWNISQMIMKTIPISARIAISYAMNWAILSWSY